ncbi:NAD(P)-dependent oxidoreductase [Dactylosporangium siamense]|uniref:Dehydrogenase n=1 Tax=Dactylosporangium siamense TaxID=685454 RepID=A0A919PHB6_9ACTN|nr:NAD(P)-dependent oxidoreductase [Dactylosporangium siamense]GIG42575.1 dehydrogenase [Dactylosporangium siamense]
MLVWLPPDLAPADLGPLPETVRPAGFGTGDPAGVEVVVLAPPQRGDFAARLPELTGLRLVQTLNAGIDWVPALPAGVTLCNSGDVHSGPVAEWIVGVILAMRRRLVDFARRSDWDGAANTAFSAAAGTDDLADATVLVVGYGSIGRALHARLTPFGAHVVGVRRGGPDTLADLPALLPAADVVVLLVPQTAQTTGLVDAAFLARMRPGALLVNAARGGLVDTAALLAAVRAGHVRAALDVTDPEPLPAGHPLWAEPGVLVTPHTAGSVSRWRQRAARLVGAQLRRYAAGEPLDHRREAGY